MSTIGGGGAATSAYDSLTTLMDFVKSPDAQARVKELRDLEASSKAASEQAAKDIAESEAMAAELSDDMAKHETAASQLKADQMAHSKRVARINAALAELQRAISG